MSFLPIVERELRVASRQRSTYWIRLGAAVGAIAIGAWIMLMPFVRSTQNLGLTLFYCLSVLAYVHCLLSGVLTTADCLSQEKREGTFGLLFLTDLKGYDIVLGKLTASSLNAFYGVLAIFPVLAIPLLIGGVSGGEFGRVVAASMNNLFFSLAVGMFCSSVCRDERQSIFFSSGLLLSFTFGLPVAGAWVATSMGEAFLPGFFLPSPGYASFMAYDESFKSLAKFNFFYESLLSVHLLGWAFLGLACWIAPRTWQDRVTKSPARLGRRRWVPGPVAGARLLRARLLEINPFYWLASRGRLKKVTVWAFLALAALIWCWGLWKYPRDWRDQTSFVLTALILHTWLKISISFEACRRFVEDRRSGALELLLSTPLSVPQIVQGQLMALARHFGGPVALVTTADFIFLFAERDDREWVFICLAGITVFLTDLVALSVVGMWLGLNSRTANRAALATIVRILVLPWLAFALLMTVLASMVGLNLGPADGSLSGFFPLLAWLLPSLLLNLYFGLRAYWRLLHDFRTAALETPDKPRWGTKQPSPAAPPALDPAPGT